MSTIKVNNVIPPNAGEGVTIDGLQMPTAGPLSNRNLIINGRFRVDQRNNGSAVTLQTGYTVDRFRVHGPTANQFTVDQQTTGVRVTYAAVGSFGHFGTPLEQQELLPYLGQKMTISFKVRGSTSISQTLQFIDTPTPTSGTAIDLDTSTYNVTTSWQTVTRTFTMPSSLSHACVYVSLLQLNSTSMAVNDWVEVDEVQLEAGEKNTPFEHRSYSEELQKCMRYYQTTNNTAVYNNGPTGTGTSAIPMWYSGDLSAHTRFELPVRMRTSPSASFIGNESAGTALQGTYVSGDDGTIGVYYIGGWQSNDTWTFAATETTENSVRMNCGSLPRGAAGNCAGLYFYGTGLTSTVVLNAEL